MISQDFWKGRRVFLTGHTGFKGSWIALWLCELGADVTGYSLPPDTKPSLFESAELTKLLKSEYGDIRNQDQLKHSLQKAKPEVVIHMAAQPLVRLSYTNPIETFETNVMGTLFLIQSLREIASVKSVVVVTTDKCYENPELNVPFREEDPLGGYDPYSSSKACAEIVTSAMRRSFFSDSSVGIGTARAGNVIGGGDWATDRLIPDIVRKLVLDQTVVVRNPDSIRPWQHVLEPLAGYLALAQKLFTEGPKFGEAWNFGPLEQSAWPVHKIADTMTKLWSESARWEIDTQAQRVHEAKFLRLSTKKAENRLDWRPLLKIEEALEWTCRWYLEFQKQPNSARRLCLDQIKHYSTKILQN